MVALSPRSHGMLLGYVIFEKLGRKPDFEGLLSSASQLGKLGVLLAQTTRYMKGDDELASYSNEVKVAIRTIFRLSHRSSIADKVGGRGPEAIKLKAMAAGKSSEGSDIVALRMSVTKGLAKRLLALSTSSRVRVLWLITSPRVSRSVDLLKLLEHESQILAAGRGLNLALRSAGRMHDLSSLAPAMIEALSVLKAIRPSDEGADP